MRIAYLTSELAPWAKTGGLGDVSAALPPELQKLGHEVRVFLPLYARVRVAAAPGPALERAVLRLGALRIEYGVAIARLPGTDLDVWLIDCPPLYERPGIYTQDDDEHLRFLTLTCAALDSCRRSEWTPDIVHAHDWQTALAPLYLKSVYRGATAFARTRTVLTIHNLGYQGVFGAEVKEDLGLGEAEGLLHQDDLRAGRLGFLKSGLAYADALSTVSPTYAREIQTERYGMGLDGVLRQRARDLVGILNGIDVAEWNPRTDKHLTSHYSEKSLGRKETNKEKLLASLGLEYAKRVPVVGIVSRLTAQKGIELLESVIPEVMGETDLRFVALGSGEPRLEHMLQTIQQRFPGRACFFRGFNEALAHQIEAGADLFLMPSLYEPCGLNQMYSMRYGTAPVVRATGGLADTVHPFDPATGEGTGFVFEHYTQDGLRWALRRGLQVYGDARAWRKLQTNGMAVDFSWTTSARRYQELYERVAATAEVPR